MLYLLSTSCVLTLAFSTLFPLVLFGGYSTATQFLRTRGSSPRATRSTRISRRSTPSRRPCGAQLPSFVLVLRFRILFIRQFFIYVINNIRTLFIISFTWYVLWYIVHSVVYTCDLILARIWLLGLCPFINRVLQSGIRAVSTVGRSLDITGRVLGLLLSNPCLLKLFYYYTPWILWFFTLLAMISLSEE